jgi:ADP-heptose:LPS heptosyltransferase
MNKAWMIAARDVAWLLLDELFRARRSRVTVGAGVLVTVRLDEIGDFILWLDAAKALRRAYPEWRLVLIGNAAWSDLAARLPWFDEVRPVEVRKLRTNLGYRLKVLAGLRRLPCAKVVHPVHSRAKHLIDAESVVRVLPACEKVGSSGDPCGTWRARWSESTYTRMLSAGDESGHELERNAAWVRAFGVSGHDAGLPDFGIRLPEPTVPVEPPYYVFVPGARSELRRWPVSHFIVLADRLFALTGWHAVVCGSFAEAALADQIAGGAKAPVKVLSGQTNLLDLAGILSRARIVISNETAAVHMAAALGVRCVCVLGGGHFGRFMPYALNVRTRTLPVAVYRKMACFRCDWHCIFKPARDRPAPCVAGVAVDDVWQAVVGLLGIGSRTA